MNTSEMNRRIATMTSAKVEHVKRLIRNGYEPRDIFNFRIGATLAQINAIWAQEAV
jgi:hypothetical protein